MSTTTEPQTFSELYGDFIAKVKESATPSLVTIAKRHINDALVNVHRNPGSKFPWPTRRGVLITHAPYSTGTVTIDTATSRTAVTGASTLWATTVPGFGFNNVRPGGKITFAGDTENYIVGTVSAQGALTLETVYVGADLSAASYVYFEDEYSLAADFEDFVDIRFFSTDMEIPLVGRTDFRRATPRNDRPGKPKIATQIQVDFAGNTAAQHRVVLHPYPDDEYQIPYWYRSNYLAVNTGGMRQSRLVADSDEPVVPIGKRHGITLYACYEYFLYTKDDLPRAQTIYAEYIDFMKRISGETTASDARPQLIAGGHGRGLREQRFGSSSYIDELRDFRRWGR